MTQNRQTFFRSPDLESAGAKPSAKNQMAIPTTWTSRVIYSPENEELKTSSEPPLGQNSTVVEVDELPTSGHVSLIKSSLSLNMIQVAEIFEVTRQTVYLWLQGQEPMQDKSKHIRNIARVAAQVQHLGFTKIGALTKRPIFDSKSFLDKLKLDDIALSDIQRLKGIDEKEARTRHVRKGSGKHRRSNIDLYADISTQLYLGD